MTTDPNSTTTDPNSNFFPDTATGPRHRLQLDFSPDAYARLTEIREKSDAKSNAEVVRNAIRLYDWYLEQKKKGNKFQIVEGKTVKEVEILF